MRKLIILLLFVMVVASCERSSYTIHGTVADTTINGSTVFLFDLNNSGDMAKIIGTTVVEGGKFIFNGKFENPTILEVCVVIKQHKCPDKSDYRALVLSENRDITVDFKVPSTHYNSSINHILPPVTNSNILSEYENAIVSSNGLNGMLLEINSKKTSVDAILKETYLANKDNILGVYCLSELVKDWGSVLDAKGFEDIFADTPLAKTYAPIMKSYKRVKAIETTSAGRPIVDFDVVDVEGDTSKISSYICKDEFVLLDVRSSSRSSSGADISIVELVGISKDYPKLVVLTVAERDENDENKVEVEPSWENLYISDYGAFSEAYGTKGFSAVILIDPKGTIVHRDGFMIGNRMGLREALADIYK